MLKKSRAFIIRDDKNKFSDLEDVIKVARALGQEAFRTHEHVNVKRIWPDNDYDYVVVVEGPEQERTNRLDVRRGKKVKNVLTKGED